MKKRQRALALSAVMVLSILLVGVCGLGGTATAAEGYGWTKPADSTGVVTSNGMEPDAKKFTYREWTGDTYTDLNGNETAAADVTQINREYPHTTAASAPYQDIDAAIVGARDYKKADSDYVQMLTGQGRDWDVIVFENLADARAVTEAEPNVSEADFQVTPVEVTEKYGQWSTQQLPASWTYYGYDYTIYTNTQQPWQPLSYDPKVPFAPGWQDETQYNPVGFYRHTFTLDDSLLTKSEGGRVFISFQGVESAYYVYLNGKEVGYAEDSYRPSEFDITDYLNETGENLLVVEVHKFCDGTWLEDQDMLYDGGIFRDVFLYSVNAAHIIDYKAETDLYNDYEDAVLKLSNVVVRNFAAEELEDMALNVSLFDADGENVLGYGSVKELGTLASGDTAVDMEIDVQDVDLWSAEHPNLYTLVLTLYNEKTAESYSIISQQLGFRELEFTATDWDYENGVNNTETYQPVKLNGMPIYLKGVNRHDRVPTTGKYVSHDVYELDVKLMKQYNINTLRTSHYPDDEYMYYLADKYGLYIVAEANAESHALQDSYVYTDEGRVHADTYYFWDMLVDRTVDQYETLKNQTANIMWSIGNEMGYVSTGNTENNIFAWMINFYKTHDKTRLVHSEGQFNSLGVDVASNMYPYFDPAGGLFQEDMADDIGSGKIPYFLCEYDHGMGNAVGNMWEYWEQIRSADNMLGGCIWDWVDQSMKVKLPEGGWNYYGEDYAKSLMFGETGEMDGYYYGMGGDWGDDNNSGDFAQNGLVSPDRTPQPELNEVKYVYQNFWFDVDMESGGYSVYNESSFSNLNEYDVIWELVKNGKVIETGSLDLEAAPRETVTFAAPFEWPDQGAADAMYYVNFSVRTKEAGDLLPAGFEAAHEQLFVARSFVRTEMPEYVGGVTVDDGEDYITVTGEKFSFKVSKTTGAMEDYIYNGEKLLEKGPTPDFWRGRLNNDSLFGFIQEANTGWKKVSNTDAALADYSVTWNGKGMPTIRTVLDLANEEGSEIVMMYTVNSGGEVIVDYSFDTTNSSLKDTFLGTGGPLAVGTKMTTAPGFEKVNWYGNGYTSNDALPEGIGEGKETYTDRSQGAYKGRWESTVDDFFYPFLEPQDTGRLTGVEWLAVSNDNGTGILISGQGFEASTLHFTDDELDDAYHPYELTRHDETTINIDNISQGNGNASCGPFTLPEYRIFNGDYIDQFTIIPFDAETVSDTDDMDELAAPYDYNITYQDLMGGEVFAESNSEADVNFWVFGCDISSLRVQLEADLPIDSITSNYKFEYNPNNGKLIVYPKDGGVIGSFEDVFTVHFDLTGVYAPTGTEYAVRAKVIEATNPDGLTTHLDTNDGAVIIMNPALKGDVSTDGQVTNGDLIMIARYLIDLVEFDEDQLAVADFDDDGDVDNTDLVLIARKLIET